MELRSFSFIHGPHLHPLGPGLEIPGLKVPGVTLRDIILCIQKYHQEQTEL